MDYFQIDDKDKIEYKDNFFSKKYTIYYTRTNNFSIEIFRNKDLIFEGECKNKIKNVIRKKKKKYFFNLIDSLNILNGVFHTNFYNEKNKNKECVYKFEKNNELVNGYNGKITTYNNNIYEGYFEYLDNNSIDIFSVYLKKGKITYYDGIIKKGFFNSKEELDGPNNVYIHKNGDIQTGYFLRDKLVTGEYNKKNVSEIGKFRKNKLYYGTLVTNKYKCIGVWKGEIFTGKKYYYNNIIYNGKFTNNRLFYGVFIIPESLIYNTKIRCDNYKLYYLSYMKLYKGFTTKLTYNNLVSRIYLTEKIFVNCLLNKLYFINLHYYKMNDHDNIYKYILDLYNKNNNLPINHINNLIINFTKII